MAVDYGRAYLEAKQQGYSDDEIAQHLAGDPDKYREAIAQGYSPNDIIHHFTGISSEMRPAGDYADLSSEAPTADPNSALGRSLQQDPGLQLPIEQKLLDNVNAAGAGIGMGQLAGLATKGATGVFNYFKDALGAPKAAQALAPAEDALSAGLNAKSALASEAQASKSTGNALYAQLPQDFRVATPAVNQAADDVIASQATLPKSFQSSNIAKMASDLQEMGKGNGVPFAALKEIRSQLSDLAYNGEGADKLAAGKLLSALNKDIDAISQSPASLSNVPSQQPTAFAQDLRSNWANAANNTQQAGMDEIQAQKHFINPNVAQPAPGQLTNSDIPQNLSRASQFYAQRTALANHPVTQALSKARPEEMGKVVFSRGNVDDVNVAKAALGPVGFNAIRGQFYDQLLNARDLGSKLAKYSPEFLDSALGAEHVQGLQNLAKFKQLLSRAAVMGGATAAAGGLGGAYSLGRKLF